MSLKSLQKAAIHSWLVGLWTKDTKTDGRWPNGKEPVFLFQANAALGMDYYSRRVLTGAAVDGTHKGHFTHLNHLTILPISTFQSSDSPESPALSPETLMTHLTQLNSWTHLNHLTYLTHLIEPPELANTINH